MREKLSPEKSIWGWKLLIIAIILAFLFMWVFYLAMNNEPDYMPMNQKKAAAQAEMSQSSMTTETGNTETHQHHE